MVTLSIVIVSYNVRDDLENCLRSLAEHPPSASHEIVVVDNASSDGSAPMVRARFPEVQMIESTTNAGFARANNIGIRHTEGEFLLLLNSDTIVTAGAIDVLLEKLTHHPEAAAAGPRLVDADGKPELSFGRAMSPLNELRQKLLVRLHAVGVGPIVRRVDRLTRRAHTPDWVSGACLLVRRADADAVGLLDERFFMYGEDVDFCAALRARGRAVRFEPAAEIVHLRGRSRAQAPALAERAYRDAQLAFYAKHHPRWTPWLRWYLRIRGKLA